MSRFFFDVCFLMFFGEFLPVKPAWARKRNSSCTVLAEVAKPNGEAPKGPNMLGLARNCNSSNKGPVIP